MTPYDFNFTHHAAENCFCLLLTQLPASNDNRYLLWFSDSRSGSPTSSHNPSDDIHFSDILSGSSQHWNSVETDKGGVGLQDDHPVTGEASGGCLPGHFSKQYRI